ncbi:hypothetical protein F5B22DRAFT_620509 [Xylaria bambusicola]|uniref:uncharacterized protein n=1 Tax=Xylaria bambusicola TaxID=326684 RepID=UPI00200747E2|nr:uncharacterized protein F5B22DRAFT_620509 [Xylaria bambusicola]KAI0508617.1 hypothetical protein F5B22DRAFT_620509 [Xylaria bambusicola]
MREACRKELLATGLATFVNTRVKTIEKISDGQFEVVDHADKHWVGKKVLLSYGAREVFPDLPGYLDLYTRRIFPCMFQFGYELRGSPSGGLLAIDGLANLQHAALLTLDGHRFADKMTIYTNGDQILFESLRNRFLGTTSIHLDDRKITHVGQDTETSQVVINFEVGAKCLESFLIHRPKITIDQNLPSQLKIKPSESGGIQVAPPFYGTNVRGVYAAGDCASPMKTITNAMTMGSYAACGLSRELQTDKY